MAILFEIRENSVIPYAEVLMVEPFATIWYRDITENKELAKKEFAYVEFLTSMLKTNPYREYSEDRKEGVVRKALFDSFMPNWKPDEYVMGAIGEVKKFQEEGSLTYTYWLSNKTAAEKLIDFFTDFDMNERNPKTFMPVYKPKEITSSLNDAKQTMSSLKALKDSVDEEVFEAVKNRANKVISPFANPNSLNM